MSFQDYIEPCLKYRHDVNRKRNDWGTNRIYHWYSIDHMLSIIMPKNIPRKIYNEHNKYLYQIKSKMSISVLILETSETS